MPPTPESELLRALLPELESLAEQMVDETRSEIPSFGVVPREEHLEATLASIEWLSHYALDQTTPAPDAERLTSLGRRRAEQGIPVEDLLRAWRLSVRIGTERARSLAEELGLDAAVVIDVYESALRAADEALVPLAGGHRDARGAEGDPVGSRERFVIGALTGELEAEQVRSQAAAFGLDLTSSYRAVRACVAETGNGAGPAPAAGLWAAGGDSPEGLSAHFEGELIGFTAGEVARGSAELVAVGPSGTIDELPSSHAAAGRILNAAGTLGLAGVHDMASAALFVAVFESGDAGDALIERYIEPLAGASNGADLLATVRTWQEAGMRAEAAAERLHIHPNTLRYRLGRYEQLTGADLSDTEEIVSVWIALSRELANTGG